MGGLWSGDYERAGELFDFAYAHPEGFTITEATAALGWNDSTFTRAVRAFRLVFSDDEINLPCEQHTPNSPWVYKLAARYEDARSWAANRVRDTESRLETQLALYQSLTNATDGRTVEGRKARLLRKTYARLLEDLREMSGLET